MGTLKRYRSVCFFVAILVGLSLVSANVQAADTEAINQKILDGCKGKRGLAVILGVDDEKTVKLAADLAKTGNLLVHGIALKKDDLGRVRSMISNYGADGFVAIESLPINPMPYRNNLVNLIIVPDLASAKKAGYSREDVMRALAPFGTLLVADNGKVTSTTKPVQPGMDEWTHNMHGPDGNRASHDTVVSFPVGYRWHSGLPFNINNVKRQGNRYSSTRGMAVANGRCFTFSDSVIENLKPAYMLGQGLDQYVTARDAFSGLLLWRKKIGNVYYGGLWQMNLAPFAAVGDFVYTTSENGKLLVIDAATGKTVKTLDTTYAPGRLLVDDGVIVTTTWKNGTSVGESKVNRYERIRMHSAIDKGTVEAFDVKTGKRLWKRDGVAGSLCAADGNAYFVERSGADQVDENRRALPARLQEKKDAEGPKTFQRPEQFVVAVDLKTGKERWRVAAKDLVPADHVQEYLRVDAAGLNAVSVASETSRMTLVSILSAKDGKVLLQKKTGGLPLFFNGAIHLDGNTYDPATGKATGKSALRVSSSICTPNYVVNEMIVSNRMGGFNVDGKRVSYGGARGSCGLGSVPAYGAFYTPQNWCTCAPSQISGFICFGPIQALPSLEKMTVPPTVEKGEAFEDKLADPGKAGTEWTMSRGSEFRSSAIDAVAPEKLALLWQSKIAGPDYTNPLSANWKEFLNDPLSGPVVGDGIVAVSVLDANQVVGLDLESGSRRWLFTVGSRVDSPPTLYRGICLFGAHDGYVYALDAKTGKLRWKLRVAPNNERMMSYGKVESPWPVIGTVLVADGVAYASAGRSQGSDGGIIVRAFAPDSGKVLWSNVIGDLKNVRDLRRNDLLVKVNDTVQLMQTRLNAKTGEPAQNLTHDMDVYKRTLSSLTRNIKRWKDMIESAEGKKLEVYKKRLKTDEQRLKELKKPEAEIALAAGAGSEGLIHWNWPRLGNRKYRQMNYGNLGGELVSWDDKGACLSRNSGGIAYYSADKIGDSSSPLKGQDWSQTLPSGHQITSLVLCQNAVVAAGGIYDSKKPGEVKGFVAVISRKDGKSLAEHTFQSAVVYNGLAVVNKTLCVSLEDGTVCLLGDASAASHGLP